MKVVVIASEAVPFAKTGGLADVAGTLPRALASLGHETTLILPRYRCTLLAGPLQEDLGIRIKVPVGSRTIEGRIWSAPLPGSTSRALLVDQPAYFDRDELYDRHGVDDRDNAERFTFFARAALETVRALGLKPDVLHCNDWQTGLIPIFLSHFYGDAPGLAQTGSLLTIHNLAYQGVFPYWNMPLTGLDWRYFNFRELEFHGRLNFLKAGLVFADMISTVSPTYAREIQTPAMGCGLDDLLRSRSQDLVGIVNGIDTSVWNPATDPLLPKNYNVATVREGKAVCKAQLQRRLNLPERPDVPLFAQIGRLTPQKGWDLLAEVADDLLCDDVQMVVLGEGMDRYHELLARLSDRHSGKIRAVLEFLPDLARQIEAGADVFLMPSLYEPCGLNQLYSLAYGTVPIIHATGGLADTVVDTSEETLANGTATGFVFSDPTADSFRNAIERTRSAWQQPRIWTQLLQNGMSRDVSWTASAREYERLYQRIHHRARNRVPTRD